MGRIGGIRSIPGMRRSRAIAGLVALVLAGALLLAGHRTYQRPHVDPVTGATRADAVLALGGTQGAAVYAEKLVAAGVAPALVLSDPYAGVPGFVTSACRGTGPRPTGYRLICFVPDPRTTRGEARELGVLSARYGWHRVVVVAPTYHVSRARLIMGRCYSGDLLVTDPPERIGVSTWVYQYAYQTAGLLKAALLRGC